jgi:hypothetical protein
MKNRTRILFVAGVLAVAFTSLPAQVNHLNRKVTVSISQMPLSDALPKIGEAGGFQFSYNAEILPGDSLVSVEAKNQSVQQVLRDLLGPGIRGKVLGNHVILLADKPARKLPEQGKPTDYTITGYIYDRTTGGILSEATVYGVEGMEVASTDAGGRYAITVPGDRESQVLGFGKAGYTDTIIVVRPRENRELSVRLQPEAQVEESLLPARQPERINERKLVMALVPATARITADNIPVIESRIAQLSLFPFIGSNRFVSGLITNNVSINIFSGYSGGVNGVELGGFLNIDRNRMNGVQVGGFGNIVGRQTNGVQLSGFFNVNAGTFNGLQASGFSNVVTDTIRGVQLAGFSNILHGPMYGAQVSGFSNVTSRNVDGLQVSGFSNVAVRDVRVAQVTGFANYSRDVSGLQAAGFANIASGTNRGLQVAGFFNYATRVRGLQLAVFNVADTVELGVPVGLFSFVAKGYHTLEITANELFPVNLSFKTGVPHFYNILTAGLRSNWLSAGYGLGTKFRLAKRLSFSMDLTGNYVADNRNFIGYKGGLVRLSTTFDIRLARHFNLVLGPTLNGFAGLDPTDTQTSTLPLFFSYTINNHMVGDIPVNVWIGATAGFRF